MRKEQPDAVKMNTYIQQALTKRIEAKGLGIRALARQCGIHPALASKVHKGTITRIDLHNLDKLLNGLDLYIARKRLPPGES